jgi:hypothetical protein
VASVCCYTEGADPSSYRPRVDAANPTEGNALVDELRATIDPDRDPWSALAQTIQATVADRGRQLADRLRADAAALTQLNQHAVRPGVRAGPSA